MMTATQNAIKRELTFIQEKEEQASFERKFPTVEQRYIEVMRIFDGFSSSQNEEELVNLLCVFPNLVPLFKRYIETTGETLTAQKQEFLNKVDSLVFLINETHSFIETIYDYGILNFGIKDKDTKTLMSGIVFLLERMKKNLSQSSDTIFDNQAVETIKDKAIQDLFELIKDKDNESE